MIVRTVETTVAKLNANPLSAPRTWFNSAQASDYMSIEPGTLSLMRQRKQGPPYTGSLKLIRYKRSDLDKYLASRPRAGDDE
jgi:hypothetical protein